MKFMITKKNSDPATNCSQLKRDPIAAQETTWKSVSVSNLKRPFPFDFQIMAECTVKDMGLAEVDKSRALPLWPRTSASTSRSSICQSRRSPQKSSRWSTPSQGAHLGRCASAAGCEGEPRGDQGPAGGRGCASVAGGDRRVGEVGLTGTSAAAEPLEK